MIQHRDQRGFTLIELLVAIAIIAVLISLLAPGLAAARRSAKRLECSSNIRQFVLADTAYLNDHKVYPLMSPFVPTSIRIERLRQMGDYFGMPVPEGEAIDWPKRPEQPKWLNCPMARRSGYAEGPTVGGGIYTGYAYYGGLEQSELVKSGLGTVANAGHAAEHRGQNRGVLWADILAEFPTVEERRFEIFHTTTSANKYSDFRFHAREVDGIHQGWSDGSVRWTPRSKINLDGIASPDLRLQTMLGNFYF